MSEKSGTFLEKNASIIFSLLTVLVIFAFGYGIINSNIDEHSRQIIKLETELDRIEQKRSDAQKEVKDDLVKRIDLMTTKLETIQSQMFTLIKEARESR